MLRGHGQLFMCRVLAEFYEHFVDELQLYSLSTAVAAKCRYFKGSKVDAGATSRSQDRT